MANVSVKLICKNCNSPFTHTKTVKGNGNSYKFWAINNISRCPNCYREEKRREGYRWAIQYLSDNGINLPNLTGTPKQITYAEKLRESFVGKYYDDISSVIGKYKAEKHSLTIEALDKGIEVGQAALQKWEETRDYYLFASVYVKSAGFLIDMFLGNDIEKVI